MKEWKLDAEKKKNLFSLFDAWNTFIIGVEVRETEDGYKNKKSWKEKSL